MTNLVAQRIGRAAYATNSVATAGPEQLLVLVYDRLLRDLTLAEEAQRDGRRDLAHNELVHAQALLAELMSSLDPTAWDGGPGLMALYTWMMSELVQANITGDASRTATCRGFVADLAEAWRTAALEVRTSAGSGSSSVA